MNIEQENNKITTETNNTYPIKTENAIRQSRAVVVVDMSIEDQY